MPVRHSRPVPRVFRLYLMSALLGFLAAAAFVAIVLVLNVANLRGLILSSDIGLIALLVFWILNGIVFSGVQFAFAITSLSRDR